MFSCKYIYSIYVVQQTRESWQIVFFVAAAVYVVGAAAFCLLASGSVQPWALDNESSLRPASCDVAILQLTNAANDDSSKRTSD